MNHFVSRINKYLHPEATEFYRKVDKAVDTLNSIQTQLDDTSPFYECLGGKGYSVYAFQHNTNFKTWVNDTNKIYKQVNSFDDLLITNLLFLNGQMPMTFYHQSPIYDINTQKLESITKYFKYFTTEGQSSECNDEEKQKNYLMGVIHNDNLRRLLPNLEKSEYYYGYYYLASGEIQTNLPFQNLSLKEWRKLRPRDPDDESMEEEEDEVKTFYNLTLSYNPKTKRVEIPFTNIWKDSLEAYWENFKALIKDKIPRKVLKEIQSNCSVLEIYGKEYCKGNIENFLFSLIR